MNKKITVISLWLLSFCGCNDALDIIPENSLTFRNALETPRDIEAALSATGQLVLTMASQNFGQQEAKGEYIDDMDAVSPERILSPEYIPQDWWYKNYVVIEQANVVLRFIDQVEMTQQMADIYKGQALFYKALSYYELIRQYVDCVLIRNETKTEPLAKSSWTEVADYAIEQAEQAAELLPEFARVTDYQGNPPRYKSTPSKGAANALLAHLCAWKAGGKYFAIDDNYDELLLWQKAEQAASQVIESGTYSLASSAEEVCAAVLVGDSPESVYETVFKDFWHERTSSQRSSPHTLAIRYQNYPIMPNFPAIIVRNWPYRIYNSTVNEMFPEADWRKTAYFYDFEEMSKPANLPTTGGFAYPYKWRRILVQTTGSSAGNFINYDVNRIWWRLADIVLLRAECRTRLGNDAGAISDLNVIRSRANANLYAPTEHNNDLRYTIFKEREKELLMEGHRYYDIIRNGYARTELEGGFRTATDQDFRDGAFFLIIPPGGDEFSNNPLMRQNTYWSRFL